MPSSALAKLKNNLIDVDRLIEAHTALGTGQPGRHGLGHITRSGVVMLCGAWELYAEQVLVEAVRVVADRLDLPDQLPVPARKRLSAHVKGAKNELKPLELAGTGWKTVYVRDALDVAAGVNTPKSHILDEQLFTPFVGCLVSTCWTCGADAVDDFVSVRGDIAHRGRDADYVTIWRLRDYRAMIFKVAIETDNHMANEVKSISPTHRIPWQRSPLP